MSEVALYRRCSRPEGRAGGGATSDRRPLRAPAAKKEGPLTQKEGPLPSWLRLQGGKRGCGDSVQGSPSRARLRAREGAPLKRRNGAPAAKKRGPWFKRRKGAPDARARALSQWRPGASWSCAVGDRRPSPLAPLLSPGSRYASWSCAVGERGQTWDTLGVGLSKEANRQLRRGGLSEREGARLWGMRTERAPAKGPLSQTSKWGP